MVDLPAYLERALPAAAGLATLSSREMLYLVAYLRQAAVSPRTLLLLRAVFVTAVGTVEPWATSLVRLLMYHVASQEYSSLADPRLDQQAREACFGPPGRWQQAFQALGVSVISGLVDWPAWRETAGT